MTTGIYLDSEYEKDYDIGKREISIHSNEIPKDSLPEAESNRIDRMLQAASNSIHDLLQTKALTRLDVSRVSEVPTSAVRVTEAAQNAGIVPASNQEMQDLIESIETHRIMLENEEIPLSDLISADAIAELDNALPADATETDKRGFLIQINSLVADIMKLISKLNDRERQKNDHMKKEYSILNTEIGGAIASRGATNFWSNVGALFTRIGGTIIGGAIGSDAFQKATDAIGQQIPGLTGILSTKYEVTQTMSSNRLSSLTTDMQNSAQKTGDNSGWKNELTQALNDVRQWMTSAARSN